MEDNLLQPIPAGKTQKISRFLESTDTGDRTQVIELPSPARPPIAADSHPGFCRTNNEDSFGFFGNDGADNAFLAVADGIGGHGNGEFASNLLIRLLLLFWRKYKENLPSDRDQVMRDLYQAVRAINLQIYDLNVASENKMPMGTTLAALVLLPGFAVTIHLGDSRVYLVRDGKIARLTEDHSYISELLRAGVITPEKAATHPLAHTILRSVGPVRDVEPEIHAWERLPGDRFIVCSDGLTEHLSDDQILHCTASAPSAADAVRVLIHNTLRDGARDNVTVLCAFA